MIKYNKKNNGIRFVLDSGDLVAHNLKNANLLKKLENQ